MAGMMLNNVDLDGVDGYAEASTFSPDVRTSSDGGTIPRPQFAPPLPKLNLALVASSIRAEWLFSSTEKIQLNRASAEIRAVI